MDAATALHYHMDMVVSATSCEMFSEVGMELGYVRSDFLILPFLFF